MGITRDFANIIRSNGDIVISGDLDVNGTQTTINTTTFVVEDKNIELGANATSNSQNDGAGISILLPDASPDEFATLTYGNTADAWSFNKKVGIGTSSPNTTLTLSDGTDEFDFGVTANQLIIKSVTSDGSDDQRIIIDAGNGGLSSTRGAYIALSGNEASIEAGKSIYQMGNVAGSSHVFRKAGGNDAVTIDSDGNVGIGTANGDVTNDGFATRTYVGIIGTANRGRLNIGTTASDGADAGTLAFTNGANVLADIVVDTTAGVQNTGNLNINSTDYIRFTANGNEALRIDSSGNVGINSSGNTTSTLDLTEPSDTAERAIRIENSSARLYVGVEGAAANRFVGSAADNGFIGTTTPQGLEFGTNNNVRMVINSSGNVGIGTTSPDYALDVYDVGEAWIRADSSTSTEATANSGLRFAHAGVNHGVLYHRGSDDAFLYFDNIASETRFIINSSGNVGIGADNPNAKLHVIRTTTEGAQRTIYADGNQLSEISSSGTNYLHNVWIENRNFDINSGVTDSGYRIGLNIEGYHDSNVFEGTLATQKNIWSRVGNNTGGTGTITDLYNMHLETLSGGGLTVTNNWGLYQTGSGTKNYFEGSVGIGTGSPFAKLSVTGASASANDSGIFQITDGTGANTDTKITMGVVSSDYGWIQAVKPGTDVFDLVLNPNGGNVGIGTSSPRRKLEVYGAAGANVLQSQDSADSTNFLRMYSDVTAGSAINVNTGGVIRFAHSDESFAPFVERMRIDASGNVGIGTISPNDYYANKLVVSAGYADGITIAASATTDLNYLMFADTTTSIGQGWIGYYHDEDALTFASNSTERMRIDASGFTKAKANGGNFFGGSYHELINNNNTSGQRCLVIGNNAGSATNNTSSITVSVSDNGNDRLFIYGNGDVSNVNNSYGGMSDAKLKENIVDASPKLEGLLEIKVRNYNLIGETNKQIGVIAQELEQIFPSMVSETPDRDIDGNDLGTVTKSVKYSVFVPMLIKAIQEQQATIEALTARIAALES